MKRHLNEISGGFYEVSSVSKRRRLEQSPPTDRPTILLPLSGPWRVPFSEKLEYSAILFTSIKQSPLISKMSVPTCIVQEIAEFGEGFVELCANSKCSAKVVVLEKDLHLITWNLNLSCFHHESYQFIRRLYPQERCFYCSSCQNSLEYCDDCSRKSFVPECDKCSNCCAVIMKCDCEISFECPECSCILCKSCRWNELGREFIVCDCGRLPCRACVQSKLEDPDAEKSAPVKVKYCPGPDGYDRKYFVCSCCQQGWKNAVENSQID